ncbi:hypothetical protein ACWDE9_12040 [Streptomyces olivaceoviridis]
MGERLVTGPGTGHRIGIYLQQNQQFYAVTPDPEGRLPDVERWSASRAQWVKEGHAFIRNLAFKALPYIVQGTGRLIPGAAGNRVYLSGVAAQAAESMYSTVQEGARAYRGDPQFNPYRFAGSALQVLGHGARAGGNYSGFPQAAQYSAQAAGNYAIAAGTAIASFPGPPPRNLPAPPAGAAQAASYEMRPMASGSAQRSDAQRSDARRHTDSAHSSVRRRTAR